MNGLRALAAGFAALSTLVIALLMVTFVAAPRLAQATNGQCIWEGGPGANTYPECLTEDCLGAGGVAQCMDPVIRPATGYNDSQVDGQMYNYYYGDGQELDLGNFCQGEGGTWNGLYGNPACANLPTGYNDITDTNTEMLALQGASEGMSYKFGSNYNPSTGTGGCGSAVLVGDTGWGEGTVYENGTIVTDNRTQTFIAADSACNPTSSPGIKVSFAKRRQMLCPNPSNVRSLPNGYLQCYVPSTGCVYCDLNRSIGALLPTIDNPVSPVTGGKVESRTDYQGGGGVGELSFGHFYNSLGYLTLPGSGPFMTQFSDYWHFSYDRRLFAITGNSQLMAVIHREDGTLEWFNGSGAEILNQNGAADRLTVGSGGGWTLTLGNSDVERYDANGNLTGITTRAGIVTTISYGANGKMSQVTDSFGHTLQLSYDANARLVTVTLPDGSSTINYAYGTVGQLTDVIYADQSHLSYEYEDPNNLWLLTGITDENLQRYATYTYTPQGTVASEQHAGGVDAYTFSTGGIASTYSSISSYATDAFGQKRSYLFTNAGGVFKLYGSSPYCSNCWNRNYAGWDTNGNPKLVADLDGNQTTYVYDQVRNLETFAGRKG